MFVGVEARSTRYPGGNLVEGLPPDRTTEVKSGLQSLGGWAEDIASRADPDAVRQELMTKTSASPAQGKKPMI